MRSLLLLSMIASTACTSGSVEDRRRELCRQLCASMRCDPAGAEPPSLDDSCVQSCFNTSNPGAAPCLTYLEAWVTCRQQNKPSCSGGADPCRREQCASGTCDSCQGCRFTCPEPNLCVTERGGRTSCD